MTISQALTTLTGAFMFPFLCRIGWGRLVDKFGPIGGWIAAAFITGTMWLFNHGLDKHLIVQTGVWVDMGLAAGVGVWVATAALGFNKRESRKNLASAILAGVVGGFILSLM